MRDILLSGADEMGLTLTEEMCRQFETYWRFLEERNRVMNLTAITGREEVAKRHFLDCLAMLNEVEISGRVVDIGTGAGFPGLPLKIARPELELTLLDSLNKRVGFLQETCFRLRLEGVEAVHARAEERVAEPGEREGYDFAVSRAVARLNLLAELCLPFVRPGGRFVAMKAEDSREEIDEAKEAFRLLGGRLDRCIDYTVPGTEVRHRLVVVEKTGPTPKAYPRRFAKIQKQPLGAN